VLFLRRRFEQGDLHALVGCRQRGTQGGVAFAHHDDVVFVLFH
jgi:hypothetical protein